MTLEHLPCQGVRKRSLTLLEQTLQGPIRGGIDDGRHGEAYRRCA